MADTETVGSQVISLFSVNLPDKNGRYPHCCK